MTDDRTRRVQQIRRSNAAGPHRSPFQNAQERRQAIVEALADELAAEAHQATYEPDYGVRFVCSCGTVSGYYTSKAAAQEAHAEHVHPQPKTPGKTVLS